VIGYVCNVLVLVLVTVDVNFADIVIVPVLAVTGFSFGTWKYE
jgi:hypothetical protein